MTPIDVAVNLLWCIPGRVGGSEEYLVRQLAGLAELTGSADRISPTLLAQPSFRHAHPGLVAELPTATLPIELSQRPVRVAAEHTWLAAKTRAADVVHHAGGTAPRIGRRPVLLTVHDLQFLSFPEYLTRTKLHYLRTVVPRSVRRAALVATPSEYVRATVVEAYGVPSEQVTVVPHGVPARSSAVDVDEAQLRDRYALGHGPIVVYPAITHPHKNHRLLLDVLSTHWTDPDLRLVLLGGRGLADVEVERAIDSLGLRQRVVRPGRVPDGDRDGLVSIADALVFPSRYEGFGAPLVEAMALGTPVICSDHPAVREVVGDAAIVLPDDVDAWAGALDRVRRERRDLVAAGRRRSERYTTAVSATALVAAYERVAS
jgi:glycosyltransferase involved in cell wall biosynthesis